MPELDWDLTDFIEALEVLPQSEEYGTEHIFEVRKDGLRLEVTVWPLESMIYLDLYREGIVHPITGHALLVRGVTELVKEKGADCLRIRNCVPAPSRFSYRDFAAEPHDMEGLPCHMTVRLSVRPHIRIEYEREGEV